MVIYKQLILLFGLMLTGFICYKTKILNDTANKAISRFITNVALPATILNSAIGQELSSPENYLIAAVIWLGVFVLFPVISFLICKLLKYDKTMELMLAYANIGFMGLPLVAAIYGDESLIYVVIGMMFFNLSLFSYGVFALKREKEKTAKLNLMKSLRSCINPGTLCAVLAILILIFQVPVPDVLGNILNSLGSVTVPLAMVVIGSTLGNVSFREMFTDPKLYIFTVLRTLFFPALTLLVLKLLRVDSAITGIVVLLSSLPTAGNVSMLVAEYDGDLPLVSKGTCITTLVSAGTVPLWIFILSLVLK